MAVQFGSWIIVMQDKVAFLKILISLYENLFHDPPELPGHILTDYHTLKFWYLVFLVHPCHADLHLTWTEIQFEYLCQSPFIRRCLSQWCHLLTSRRISSAALTTETI